MSSTEAMTSQLREELWLSPEFPTREALEAEVVFWDATSAYFIADCPRKGQHRLDEGLRPSGEAYPLLAGRAVHAGLAVWYYTRDLDLTLGEVRRVWGKDDDWVAPGRDFAHLTLGHLEVIMRNYADFSRKRDTFKPLLFELDDLNLENVVAAMWVMTPDNKVMLAESKVVMRFVIEEEDDELIYSGKPDLPIFMGGVHYCLDHKSTSSYLSDWWAKKHKLSNQLRGYCKMVSALTGLHVQGALINGVYVGKKASSSEFKGSRFARYGPMVFSPGLLNETMRNQYWWKKTLNWYQDMGYFPQNTGQSCVYCPYLDLCKTSPRTRAAEVRRKYVEKPDVFLDL